MSKKRMRLSLGLSVFVFFLLSACTSPNPTPITPASTASPASKITPSATASPTAALKTTHSPGSAPVSFAGKTITFIVSTDAGGGTDIIARLYARHLAPNLPGKPSTIVRNMPGSGEVIGVNYTYGAKGDGLTALILTASANMAQLLGVDSVRYDLLKMRLVVGTSSSSVIYANANVVDKPENLMNARGLVFGQSVSSSQLMLFVLAKEFLNFPVDKIITGYSGSADSRRALLGGEITATADTTSAFRTSIVPLVGKGQIVPLWQSGRFDEKGNMVRDPDLPDNIPTIQELSERLLGKSPSGPLWNAMRGLISVSRVYDKIVTPPPNTPDNIVSAYREAAAKMVADPEYQKASAPLNGEKAHWWLGDVLQNSFARDFKLEPAVMAALKETLEKYGLSPGRIQ